MDVLHIKRLLYYQRCLFCVRAGCKIQLASYNSKHTSQSLSDNPFVHSYTQDLKTAGHIWTFSILYDCSTIRDISLRGLELQEKSDWRGMAQDMHQSFSVTALCAYTTSLYIQATVHDNNNKTHVSYDCILHTKLWF